jgi:ABC-type nitrate/sulfonate/bicarbonate transport system ATPase subunit
MLDIKINCKNFNEKKILENINIKISNGEFISIIGPSGCGKTTLLNLISKLDLDFNGIIHSPSSKLSFIFQDDRLVPWLTIKENLLLVSENKDLNRIYELLNLVKLENFIDYYPNKISGGMKRRISIIRAFVNNPNLILMDEPFVSLDYPTSLELKKDFLILCKKFNPTVILVTHDISEAIFLSNRILFLNKEPASIIYEFKNPNNQVFDLEKIDSIKNEIFGKFPNILKGELL